MTTDQQTAQQRHRTVLDRIDQQTAFAANLVVVAHQAGHPDRDIHAAALTVLQGRRRILARHAPHPDHPYWCAHCSHSPNSWGWAEDWPCPDWLDAACEVTP